MTAAELLADLRSRGLKLWVNETRAGLEPQLRGNPTAEDVALVKTRRDDLIKLLLEEKRAEAEANENPNAVDRVIPFSEPTLNLALSEADREAAARMWEELSHPILTGEKTQVVEPQQAKTARKPKVKADEGKGLFEG